MEIKITPFFQISQVGKHGFVSAVASPLTNTGLLADTAPFTPTARQKADLDLSVLKKRKRKTDWALLAQFFLPNSPI